jgi:hypothetical protein
MGEANKCDVFIWAYILDGYQITPSNRELFYLEIHGSFLTYTILYFGRLQSFLSGIVMLFVYFVSREGWYHIWRGRLPL